MTATSAIPLALPKKTSLLRRLPWQWILLTLLLLAYTLFLFSRFAPATTEPDDNGYFAQGSLLAQTGHTWFTRQSDAQYIGMHWLISPTGQFISRYPPGLPMVIAALYSTLGYKAATLVNPLLALASLYGFFLLSRRLLKPSWSLAGVILLAANPTFVHHALGCDSHMGVLFLLVWGLYCALRWWQQEKLWQIFIMGLFLGCIPSVRYGDSVLALGLIVFLLWSLFTLDWFGNLSKLRWHYLAAILGAAIPILPLLIRNQLLMGAFWRTGYSLTNEETGFSWAYFKEHAIDYIRQVNANGVGILFGLGVLGITVMISLPKFRRLGIMFALQTLAMLLLYMAYYWAPQNNAAATMRFLLPIFPILLLSGLWFLAETTQRIPQSGRVAIFAMLLTMQLLWGTAEAWDQSELMHYQKQVLAQVTDSVDAVAQPGDVIVAAGNALQHLDFVRKWKLADLSLMRGNAIRGGGGAGRFGNNDDANAPSPRQSEKLVLERQLYPTETIAREDKFVKDIQTWAGDHNLYFLGTQTELDALMADKGPDEEMKVVSRIALPDAPVIQNPNGRNMFGGGRNRAAAGGRRNNRGGALAGGAPGGNIPGGPPGPAGMGPGGPGAMGEMNGERELLIAQWTFKNKALAQNNLH